MFLWYTVFEEYTRRRREQLVARIQSGQSARRKFGARFCAKGANVLHEIKSERVVRRSERMRERERGRECEIDRFGY